MMRSSEDDYVGIGFLGDWMVSSAGPLLNENGSRWF